MPLVSRRMEALLQVDALGRAVRRGGRHHGPTARSQPAGTRPWRSGSPRCRSRSRRSRRSSQPRRASSTSTTPPARRAPPSVTCSRTRRGFRSRGSSRSRRLDDAGSTRTQGFEVLGEHVGRAAAMPFASVRPRGGLRARSGSALDPEGHPGAGMHASLDDVLAIGRELLAPRLVAAETHAEMVRVQFPGLDGVLPDFGRFAPLDWGLGVEIKAGKTGHWTGRDLARDVRALRGQRHLPLGRSRARDRRGGSHHATVRPVGEGGLARARRRDRRRAAPRRVLSLVLRRDPLSRCRRAAGGRARRTSPRRSSRRRTASSS